MTTYYREASDAIGISDEAGRQVTRRAIVTDWRIYTVATLVNVAPAVLGVISGDLTAAGIGLLASAIATVLGYLAVVKVTLIDKA